MLFVVPENEGICIILNNNREIDLQILLGALCENVYFNRQQEM